MNIEKSSLVSTVVAAIAASIVTALSAGAFACPNFSGRYKTDNDSPITITQKGCDEITLSGKDDDGDVTLTLKANNQEQVVPKSLQSQGEDYDGAYTANFTTNSLVVKVRTLPHDANAFNFHATLEYKLLLNGDMEEVVTDTSIPEETTTIKYQRVP